MQRTPLLLTPARLNNFEDVRGLVGENLGRGATHATPETYGEMQFASSPELCPTDDILLCLRERPLNQHQNLGIPMAWSWKIHCTTLS